MKVSIIIPVYNVAPYIEDCLNSITAQTYKGEMECILVDDCGTDDSIAICQVIINQYIGQIEFKIVHHDKNRGLSAARNTGMMVAKGEWLYFIDSDDYIFPNAISKLIELTKQYPKVDMVQGNMKTAGGYEKWSYKVDAFPEYSEDIGWIRRNMLKWNIPQFAWNKLIRRSFITDNRLEFPEGYIHEDVKWGWDCQKYIKSIAICNDYCYWYRTDNSTSIMHYSDKTKSFLSKLWLVKYMAPNITNDDEFSLVAKQIYYFDKVIIWKSIKNKDKVKKEVKDLLRVFDNSIYGRRLYLLVFILLLPNCVLKSKVFVKLHAMYENYIDCKLS